MLNVSKQRLKHALYLMSTWYLVYHYYAKFISKYSFNSIIIALIVLFSFTTLCYLFSVGIWVTVLFNVTNFYYLCILRIWLPI